MRHYSEESMSYYLGMIQTAKESIGSVNYRNSISQAYVLSERYKIKSEAYDAATRATGRTVYIQNQLDSLYDIMTKFNKDVSSKSEEIYEVSEKILAIIEENNRALVAICDVLRGVGNFAGKVATRSALESVGFDETKNNSLRDEVWGLLFDKYFDADSLPSDETINAYIESLKKKVANNIELTDEEKANLVNIYNGIVVNRFGKTGDIRDMSDLAIQNGIDVFELLYPKAKDITDKFFSQALNGGDETVQLNIVRIKYAMYTADPEYRDVMLYYLPYINELSYNYSGTQQYCGFLLINGVLLDLTINYDEKDPNTGKYKTDNPFGAFFHELGHGIDDVSTLLGNTSQGMRKYLVEDLRKTLGQDLDVFNCTNKFGYYLSSEEKKKVIDFIMSPLNVNVASQENDPNSPYFLPADWTPAQIEAFKYIRDQYGYTEYYYANGVVNSHNPSNGSGNMFGFSGVIISDIIGGLTNNQIGGIGEAHRFTFNSSLPYYDKNTISGALSTYYYWYDPTSVEKEFFAEAYNFGVQGTNVKSTRDIFGSAYKEYDQRIKDIYNKIPHIEF